MVIYGTVTFGTGMAVLNYLYLPRMFDVPVIALIVSYLVGAIFGEAMWHSMTRLALWKKSDG